MLGPRQLLTPAGKVSGPGPQGRLGLVQGRHCRAQSGWALPRPREEPADLHCYPRARVRENRRGRALSRKLILLGGEGPTRLSSVTIAVWTEWWQGQQSAVRRAERHFRVENFHYQEGHREEGLWCLRACMTVCPMAFRWTFGCCQGGTGLRRRDTLGIAVELPPE